MATFLTIGYGDRDGYDRVDPEVRNAAHAHDEGLRAAGVLMGIAGSPVQVRNHEGARVVTTEGPFMAAELPVAGFALIDAATLEEAVEMVSRTPCAVAHGRRGGLATQPLKSFAAVQAGRHRNPSSAGMGAAADEGQTSRAARRATRGRSAAAVSPSPSPPRA
jgi:hypothetical protein